jgi:hypothetical protein
MFSEHKFVDTQGDFTVAPVQNDPENQDEAMFITEEDPNRRKQHVQLINRSIFENNSLQDHVGFDMFQTNKIVRY